MAEASRFAADARARRLRDVGKAHDRLARESRRQAVDDRALRMQYLKVGTWEHVCST
jgi:hypothetical protein